jgi:pyruvate,water dikinase
MSTADAGGTYAVPLAEPAARERSLVGGKAASLAGMIAEGLRVPPGFAVTADACRLFLGDESVSGPLRAAIGSGRSAEVAELVAKLPVPAPVADAVRAGYAALAERVGEPEPAVAVRSSAVAEDAEAASFAGEFESYLWVSGADAVLDALKRCWSSLFTERALEYQARHGVDPADNAMAVAVQLMVDAEVAGVMFTIDPVTGDPSRISIEACWGLGVGVVNGEVNPDHYLVDKISLEVLERHVGDKATRYGPPAGGGDSGNGGGELEQLEVPADRRAASCLTDEQVAELARLGLALHKAERRAQDIEWALDARIAWPDNLFLLQRRPETVHSQRKKALAGNDVTQWIAGRLTAGRKLTT